MRKKILLPVLLLSTCLASCGTKSYQVEDYRTVMEFHDDFRIMQVTDIHMGLYTNYVTQIKLFENMFYKLDSNGNITNEYIDELPHLIVLTGDIFSLANKSIVINFLTTVNNLCKKLSEVTGLTKFAFTYGNHDLEGDYSKHFINNEIKKFVAPAGKEKDFHKYAAFIDYSDDNIYGLTNYYIDLVKGDNVKYRVHIIDSNSNLLTGFKYQYDVIHDDQLAHVENIYNSSVDKDYIGLAYFHIPFEEFELAINTYNELENKEVMGQGEFKEKISDPHRNNGSFKRLRASNIHAYFVGHNHINYGDLLYNYDSTDINEKAILSYGVKSNDLVYYDQQMIGYKVLTLKDYDDDSAYVKDFLSVENIKNNYLNVTDRYGYYGK